MALRADKNAHFLIRKGPGLQHHFQTVECWCKPRIVRLCPECDTEGSCCWLCSGEGTISVLPNEVDTHEAIELIFIHNA